MEYGQNRISVRQLSAVVWAAVLAPAVGLLPGLTVERAGAGGWLCVLLALAAVLLLSRMVWRLTGQGRENLAQAYCGVLGRGLGQLLNFIYIVWGVVLLALRLRLGGQRLLFTSHRDGGLWLFVPVMAAIALWLAWGKLSACARAAEVFFGILAVMLGAVTLMTAFQIRAERLWPLWVEDISGVCAGAADALGVLSGGIYAGFLLDRVAPPREGVRQWNRRAVEMCLLVAAVELTILGNFGTELTMRLENPFITLSKNVGVEGAFQRVEGLVCALWLYSDVTMLALLLWSLRRLTEQMRPELPGKAAAAAGVILALLGAGIGFKDAYSARQFARGGALAGDLILGFVVPAIVFLIAWIKGGMKRGSTSCGPNK